MAVIVDLAKCSGCGDCAENCPMDSITIVKEKAVIDEDTCADCFACIEECPNEAIREPG